MNMKKYCYRLFRRGQGIIEYVAMIMIALLIALVAKRLFEKFIINSAVERIRSIIEYRFE